MSSNQKIIDILDNTSIYNDKNIMFEQYKLYVDMSRAFKIPCQSLKVA